MAALSERLESLEQQHAAPARRGARRAAPRAGGAAAGSAAAGGAAAGGAAARGAAAGGAAVGWRNFPAASQADLVLGAQKDAYYRREVRQATAQAAEAVLGPFALVAVQPELKLLAELAYVGLTTLRGRQTLGEEYVDIFPVARVESGPSDHLAPPSLRRRLLLVVLAVVAPYLSKRLTVGWKPLLALIRGPQTARDRAASLRRQMLARQQQQQRSMSTSSSSSALMIDPLAEEASYFALAWNALKKATPWVLGWSALVYRWHLVLFYFKGEFYDVSKRVAGVRYAFTREPQQARPSYSILGWFLLTQLVVESASSVKQAFQAARAAWQERGARAADEALSAAPDTDLAPIVPALPDDDNSLTVIRDDRHARGLEDIKCGICLSAVNHAACPPCGHLFCFEHVMEAVAVKPECPLCRMACQHRDVQCVYMQL
jgi:peroxin-10